MLKHYFSLKLNLVGGGQRLVHGMQDRIMVLADVTDTEMLVKCFAKKKKKNLSMANDCCEASNN